jgi:uncharacterized protein YjgD (DUF1641 family)
MTDDMDARLRRVENKLERVLSLLEGRQADLVPSTVQAVGDQLVAVHGEDAVKQQLGETLLRLSDPEALESLTRIVELAPRVEYAVQAVAAGPALLEDGLVMARELSAEHGEDPGELENRLKAAGELLLKMTSKGRRDAVARLVDTSPSLVPVAEATARASSALAAVEGQEALTERLAEAIVQLTERGTLDSLVLLAQLAPRLEYAAQAVAAGPALLEDGLAIVREKLQAGGGVETERLELAGDAVLALTRPQTLEALSELAPLAPHLAALVQAAGEATAARADVEGEEAFRGRLGEAVLRLTDPDTLETLVNLAELSPKLEYAAQAAAAAPELLEELLHTVRDQLAQRGASDLTESVEAATDAALVLAKPDTLETLGRLGGLAPHLGGLAEAAARATTARAAVEGETALRARVEEAVLELTDPEVMDSLVRVAQLAPKLEYAAQAAAAAPVLLEDLLETIRDEVGPDGDRVESAVQLLKSVADPRVLRGLSNLTAVLPGLATEETTDALGRLTHHLPTLEKAAQVAWWAPSTLEAAAKEAGFEKTEDLEPQLRKAVVLAVRLAEPNTLEAMLRLADQSERIVPLLNRLAEVDDDVDLSGLADVFITVARPRVQESLTRLMELAPTLVPVLESLPVQPQTLEILKAVNAAVEDASTAPDEVGAWGLFRSMGDADVRRAVGFGREVARRVGSHLSEPPGKRLPSQGSNGRG